MKPSVLILVPHKTSLDPRIDWLLQGFAQFANVYTIGVIEDSKQDPYIVQDNLMHINTHYVTWQQEKANYEHLFTTEHHLRTLLRQVFEGSFSEPEDDAEVILGHKWYCYYFKTLDTALRQTLQTLLQNNQSRIDLILCCDLPTLLPAVSFAREYQIPLIYDAQEFWAYADVTNAPWESDFWIAYEAALLPYVQLAITVSEGLCQQFKTLYQKDFLAIPNAELKKSAQAAPQDPSLMPDIPSAVTKDTVLFLFLGGFTAGRGLEQLITTWRLVKPHCILILRGPGSAYAESLQALAKQYDLLDKTVFILPAVPEDQLLAIARCADVGLIPYDPNSNVQYRYCCPNKLSQYMAAGLPIISNALPEVTKIVDKAQCGYAVDFNQEQTLVDAIHTLGDSESVRRQKGSAAYAYFLSQYHWESVSQELYTQAKKLLVDQEKPLRNAPAFSFQSLLQHNATIKAQSASMLKAKTAYINQAVYKDMQANIQQKKSKQASPLMRLVLSFYSTYTGSNLLKGTYRLIPLSLRKRVSDLVVNAFQRL